MANTVNNLNYNTTITIADTNLTSQPKDLRIQEIAFQNWKLLAVPVIALAGCVAFTLFLSAEVALVAAVASVVGIASLSSIFWILTPESDRKKMIVNYIKMIAFEIFAFTATAITYPLPCGFYDPKPEVKIVSSHTPILMIHGYLHHRGAWLYLGRQLKNAGYKDLYSLNLGSPLLSIDDYSEKVKEKVEEIKKQTNCSQVILLCHSMGGVVASDYVTNKDKENSVKAVITLGSPLKGTKMAALGFGKCTRDMQYPSKLGLEQKVAALSKVTFYNFGSETDLIIRPTSSAYYENSKRKECDEIGHLGFLWSRKVAHQIIDILQNETPLPVNTTA